MTSHIDVHDPASVVSDEDDRVERLQGHRLNGEEIDSPYLLRMILEEGAPALRWWTAQHLTPVAMDGARTHGEAQRT